MRFAYIRFSNFYCRLGFSTHLDIVIGSINSPTILKFDRVWDEQNNSKNVADFCVEVALNSCDYLLLNLWKLGMPLPQSLELPQGDEVSWVIHNLDSRISNFPSKNVSYSFELKVPLHKCPLEQKLQPSSSQTITLDEKQMLSLHRAVKCAFEGMNEFYKHGVIKDNDAHFQQSVVELESCFEVLHIIESVFGLQIDESLLTRPTWNTLEGSYEVRYVGESFTL